MKGELDCKAEEGTFLTPAPCLTKLWISSIQSELGADENPLPDQVISKNGHAGTKWIITTSELGYGKNQIATLNEQRLNKINTVNIKDDSGTTIGFRFVWGYEGPFISGGTLTFYDESTNGPCPHPAHEKITITFHILPLESGSGS